MVCGDPATGERSGPEPLLTLAAFRRERAAINFGVLLGASAGAAPGAADRRHSSEAQPGLALQTGSDGGGGSGSARGGGVGPSGDVLRVGTPVYVQSTASPPS
jgi:hypothetical protein